MEVNGKMANIELKYRYGENYDKKNMLKINYKI